jgi:hypothetical protein
MIKKQVSATISLNSGTSETFFTYCLNFSPTMKCHLSVTPSTNAKSYVTSEISDNWNLRVIKLQPELTACGSECVNVR